MRYRQVGRSGLTVSALGLGCIQFGRSCDLDAARTVVDAALDSGVTLFDTAASYGEGESERILGEALKGRRQQAVISTKFGSRRQRRPETAAGSRHGVRVAIDGALQRLQTDYIDLIQLHFPDPKTPIEETLDALDDVVREGKVRFIGSSNFAAWQIVEAEWAARAANGVRFVSAQREYGLLDRGVEIDVVRVCERYGLGVVAWRPLGDGLLTGRYRRGDRVVGPSSEPYLPDDATYDRVEALEAFAHERGIGLLDVAIGGFATFPAVAAVLVGARDPDHIRMNAAASQWQPTSADLTALDALLPQPPVPVGR